MAKPKYKKGDFIVVHPYPNPEGLIGKIMDITHKLDQGHVYHVMYVETLDKFGREGCIADVEDGNKTFIGLGRDLKVAKILFGTKQD